MARAVEGKLDTVVPKPLLIEACRQSDLAHEPDCALLEHAGPHPRQHMRLADPLEDQRIDADAVQELTEQQPRWPRPDDDDLLAHPSGSTRAHESFLTRLA